MADKKQPKFVQISATTPPSDFVFNPSTGLIEWTCPRLHELKFDTHNIKLSVSVSDCLGRTLTQDVEIRCVSEELTFINPTDIDKVFFFYKGVKKIQEPLRPNSDKQISVQPAFYKLVSSDCVRDTDPTALEQPTVSTLTLSTSQANVLTSTVSGNNLVLSRHPSFALTSSAVVLVRYQLVRLGTTHISDSLSLNLNVIDFSTNVPYFQGLSSTMSVLTSTPFQLNPCKKKKPFFFIFFYFFLFFFIFF